MLLFHSAFLQQASFIQSHIIYNTKGQYYDESIQTFSSQHFSAALLIRRCFKADGLPLFATPKPSEWQVHSHSN